MSLISPRSANALQTADDMIRAGDLDGASAVLVDAARGMPADQAVRMFLFQLLCVQGDWDRARKQVHTLGRLSPEAQMLAVAYGQALDGEQSRADGFAGKTAASLLADQNGWATDLIAALEADASGQATRAADLRARAFDAAPDCLGEVDGRSFGALFDGDTRFGPTLEMIIAGRWGLVPFSAIEEITTEGPVDLRDLVWLPAEVRLRDGPAVAAMLPVRYPGAEHEDALLRLARRSEWREQGEQLRGAGQRVWSTDAGDDVGILSFRRICFREAA